MTPVPAMSLAQYQAAPADRQSAHRADLLIWPLGPDTVPTGCLDRDTALGVAQRALGALSRSEPTNDPRTRAVRELAGRMLPVYLMAAAVTGTDLATLVTWIRGCRVSLVVRALTGWPGLAPAHWVPDLLDLELHAQDAAPAHAAMATALETVTSTIHP